MAKFSIISSGTVLTRVNSLPTTGTGGLVYYVIPEGRVYEWDGQKYRSAAVYDGTPRYNGTYCKVAYLEFFEICSDEVIEWNIGDYVIYPRTGLVYKLYDIPQPKKRARSGEYGGAFVYQNVQFFADTKWLEIEPFRDLVPDDQFNIHFTTQASWSVWTNAATLIGRFNAVMQTAHPGEWEFRLVQATAGTPLYKLLYDTWFDFAISGDNVLQGLDKLYDLCGNIGWVHSVELDEYDNPVNIITVGIPPTYQNVGTVTPLFKYGLGNGLMEIRKSTTNRNELKTRIFAYGSTRNMIPRYYNNLTPAIKDASSVYIPNLMLPLRKWGTTDGQRDASKAYIDNNVALYGLRPTSVYFDGTGGQKEIYPSLEETTIGELKLAMSPTAPYYPVSGKHADTVRLDEILFASATDDGQRSQGGERYKYYQNINISTVSRTLEQDLELPIFSGYTTLSDGTVTLPLSRLSVVNEISGVIGDIRDFDCKIMVNVGGRTYTSQGEPNTSATKIVVKFADLVIPCVAGEAMSAILYLTFRGSAYSYLQFFLEGITLPAQYSFPNQSEFTVTIPQIGFDISTRARLGTQGIATIAMKDGMCGGRSFVVKSCKYLSDSDSWELTIYRGLDDGLDLLFPNTRYPIASGDHFVLLDIAMPETYIGMAEEKLLTAATALLNEISVHKPFFEPLLDAEFMKDSARMLLEGQYMQIADDDISEGVQKVLIDTVTISEGDSPIPTYKITLREQKRAEYNQSQSLEKSMTSLAPSSGNSSGPGGSTFGVSSFNGRTGDVTFTVGDLPDFLTGKTAQYAQSVAWTGITGKPDVYHSGNANLATVDWTCHFLYTEAIFTPTGHPEMYFRGANSFDFYSTSDTAVRVRDESSEFILTTSLGDNYIESFNGDRSDSADLYLTGRYAQNMPTLHLKADNTRAYGNFYATGQVTAGTASDLRLKENIETLADFRKVLFSLRGVSFDWKKLATERCETLEGHDVGMIAQEVEKLIPSAISPIFGDFKRLDYTKVIPYLVEGWKDQEMRITEMERKLDEIINLLKNK